MGAGSVSDPEAPWDAGSRVLVQANSGVLRGITREVNWEYLVTDLGALKHEGLRLSGVSERATRGYCWR